MTGNYVLRAESSLVETCQGLDCTLHQMVACSTGEWSLERTSYYDIEFEDEVVKVTGRSKMIMVDVY